MNGNVVYVGIDVDDVRYHGSAVDRRTGEVLSFHCRPTLKGPVGQLENLRKHFGGTELKPCYDTSYVGIGLQRDLLRSRQQLMQQQGSLRRRIRSLLRRNGVHHKAETERKTHWQTYRYGWLNRTVEGTDAIDEN